MNSFNSIRLGLALGASVLALAAGSAAFAEGPHQDGGHGDWGRDYGSQQHHWRRGQRMGYNDWNGAHPIDYRERHLRRPPNGYEWRESNGQYVLAAVATGLIASIIIGGHH